MVYLFEDKKDSVLSRLFIEAFESSVKKDIIFKGNNSELQPAVEFYLNSEEEVAIFVDLVEDNSNTVGIFRNLWRIQLENPDIIKVVPLICSEYYLLRSIENTKLVTNRRILDICLHSLCHREDTEWVNQKKNRKVSFEHYCKHVIKQGLVDCFRVKGRQKREKFYYEQPCICTDPFNTDICFEQSIIDKALKYVKEYPVLPFGSTLLYKRKMSEEMYRDYIIKRITYHNTRVRQYINFMGKDGLELESNIIETTKEGWPVLEC